MRSLAQAATGALPLRVRNPRILIADHRGTGGWTWLSLIWPGWERRKAIWITEGSLHYLEPEELKALILHEIAHHDSDNRYDIPGGWILGDVALFCLLYWIGSRFYLGAEGVLVVFFIVRLIMLAVIARILLDASQNAEHLCDFYAAEKIGAKAVINVLLKTGEEEELVAIVLARTAKELMHVPDIEMEDLLLAFEEVRPHGRIFHHNLFRHASGMVKAITADMRLKPEKIRRKNRVNEELNAYLKQRAKTRFQRIRWREFDTNDKGQLSEEEIARLCAALRDKPHAALFLAESENSPTTHPTYRNRILFLAVSQ